MPSNIETPIWKRVLGGGDLEEHDEKYYHRPRREIVALVDGSPRFALDVGCAGGGLGAAIKERFPGCIVWGIESVPAAAAFAEKYLDRVLSENVETMDFAAAGFQRSSIELLVLADVLEHLYDPWHFLERIRPFLKRGCQVLASIPNMRNIWFLNELINGRWPYSDAGLLDITHIRFFTLETMMAMLNETGYTVEGYGRIDDERIPPIAVPEGGTATVNVDRATFRDMTQDDIAQLRTVQFILSARPKAV